MEVRERRWKEEVDRFERVLVVSKEEYDEFLSMARGLTNSDASLQASGIVLNTNQGQFYFPFKVEP